MRLDARIIKGKKPFTCIDTTKAKKFEGTKGYFAEDIGCFNELDRGDIEFGTLRLSEKLQSYQPFIQAEKNVCYRCFLPREWVSGMVVMPHTPESFENLMQHLDGWITIQGKTCGAIFKGRYTGYHRSNNEDDPDCFVSIGAWTFALKSLARDYDYYNPNTKSWEPLGLRG